MPTRAELNEMQPGLGTAIHAELSWVQAQCQMLSAQAVDLAARLTAVSAAQSWIDLATGIKTRAQDVEQKVALIVTDPGGNVALQGLQMMAVPETAMPAMGLIREGGEPSQGEGRTRKKTTGKASSKTAAPTHTTGESADAP